MLELYYGNIEAVHIIMGLFGNIMSIIWGSFGAWKKLEDKNSFSPIRYLTENRVRISYGAVFTVIIFVIVPVVLVELTPGVEFSPLTALGFSLFPITAMSNIMNKAESKINV